MNPARLSTEAMARIGDHLLGAQRPALETFAAVAALLPTLASSHTELLATQPRGEADDVELARLTQALHDTDREHDRLARGVNRALEAAALLCSDEAERAEVEALHAHLFPRGVRVVVQSWNDTVGAARLLTERLEEAHWAKLAETRISGATLKTPHTWMAAAERLGELLDARRTIEQARSAKSTVRASDVIAVRNGWAHTLPVLLAALELEDQDGAVFADVLERIEEAAAPPPRSESKAPSGTPAEVDEG